MDACPSPLTELFDLKTRSVLHRPGQKDSVTFEPTNTLQLSIEHPSITTIEQALAHFSSPDVISDMVSKNGQRVSATKQVYIESFPPVLVLHLKRFNYNNKDGTVHKSNKQIRFGAELKIPQLVMSPAHRSSQNSADGQIKFKLFAGTSIQSLLFISFRSSLSLIIGCQSAKPPVVYHHGPHASGGHYTVLIRQPLIDSWIYIDDTQITSIVNPDLMLSSPSDGGIDSQIHPSPSSCHTRPNDQAHNSTDSGRSSVAHAHHNHTNGNGGGNTRNIKTPYLLFYTRA
jgi:ubiquitin carboxyl-terminal hydrolase 10